MLIAGYLLIFFLIYPVILYNSEDRMSLNQTRGHVLGRILVRGGLKMNVTGRAGSVRTWATGLSLELETNIWRQFQLLFFSIESQNLHACPSRGPPPPRPLQLEAQELSDFLCAYFKPWLATDPF